MHVTAVCPGFTYSEFHDVTGTRAQVSKMPAYMWMTAEAVAEQGYQAVMRNKAVHVNGGVNKGIVLLAKYLPDAIGLMIMRARSQADSRAVAELQTGGAGSTPRPTRWVGLQASSERQP